MFNFFRKISLSNSILFISNSRPIMHLWLPFMTTTFSLQNIRWVQNFQFMASPFSRLSEFRASGHAFVMDADGTTIQEFDNIIAWIGGIWAVFLLHRNLGTRNTRPGRDEGLGLEARAKGCTAFCVGARWSHVWKTTRRVNLPHWKPVK